MKKFIKENDVSFVFECVDMKNDPHIIEYPESSLFLLDIVKNNMDFEKYNYETMVDIANHFGIVPKEKAIEISTWQEFFDWYYDVLLDDYEYNGRKIEGFVIEDSVGYMTKLKLTYYNFWKFMRSIAHEAIKKGYISRTSALTTPLANEFYSWAKQLYKPKAKPVKKNIIGKMLNMFKNIFDKKKDDVAKEEKIPMDICSLRRMFYENKVSKENEVM